MKLDNREEVEEETYNQNIWYKMFLIKKIRHTHNYVKIGKKTRVQLLTKNTNIKVVRHMINVQLENTDHFK